MWAPTLRSLQEADLTIATTNYDRAVEIAAARLKIAVSDGFEEFSGHEIADWCGFENDDGLRLLKLHGSTNWYRGNTDRVFKLRHPMPLYGRLKIAYEDIVNQPLKSALVLPSREKIVTINPFPELAAEFRSYAKVADVAIFIGSSLRDPHMRDVCLSCAKSKPTFVVSNMEAFPPTGGCRRTSPATDGSSPGSCC